MNSRDQDQTAERFARYFAVSQLLKGYIGPYPSTIQNVIQTLQDKNLISSIACFFLSAISLFTIRQNLFKEFADDKINMIEKLKFVWERVENIVGNRGNAGYQPFFLFL